MFDARDRSGIAGSLGFGLAVTGLVAGLFLIVLQFPSVTGTGISETGKATVSQSAADILDTAFEDETTRNYLAKLQRTFPSAANDLARRVERALQRDADEVELGLIILQSGAGDIAASLNRLSKTDVSYVNALLELSSSQLQALSRSGAPYCMGDDLMMFAGLAQQDFYRAVFDRVGHGAGLYDFALEANGILLDAIRDARSDPVLHSPLSQPDMQALQQLGLSLMSNPQLVRLFTTEGKQRSEMDQVLEETNFCDLGVRLIGQVGELPDTTKGRLWAEAIRQVESGRWRYTIYRYTGL